MLLTKKGINVLTLKPKNSTLLWTSRFWKILLTKKFLQREIIGEEDNFWEKSVFIPNTIIDFPSQDTESSLQITQFFPEIENSIEDAGSGRIGFLPTEKEILQKDTCNPTLLG